MQDHHRGLVQKDGKHLCAGVFQHVGLNLHEAPYTFKIRHQHFYSFLWVIKSTMSLHKWPENTFQVQFVVHVRLMALLQKMIDK